jgi:LmbE family N-acetylglucosaminyl deacetylase
MKTVCVIAVHPDDETLGCGGTILRHIANGDNVHGVFVTSGNAKQSELIRRVSDAYGFNQIHLMNLPELGISDMSLNELIPQFSTLMLQIQPNLLYIPNRSDAHSDHRIVFQAISACTKSFRYPSIEKVMMCEVVSETDFSLPLPENIFVPNHYVDITSTFAKKKEILEYYQDELLPYPFTRNISTMESLNRYRGSLINSEYAEAFMLIKSIER